MGARALGARIAGVGIAGAAALLAGAACAQTALVLKPFADGRPPGAPPAWSLDPPGSGFAPAAGSAPGPRQPPSLRLALDERVTFVASAGKDRALRDSAARRPDGAAARSGGLARIGLSVRW